MADSLSAVFQDCLILGARSQVKHPSILCPCYTKNIELLLKKSSDYVFLHNLHQKYLADS